MEGRKSSSIDDIFKLNVSPNTSNPSSPGELTPRRGETSSTEDSGGLLGSGDLTVISRKSENAKYLFFLFFELLFIYFYLFLFYLFFELFYLIIFFIFIKFYLFVFIHLFFYNFFYFFIRFKVHLPRSSSPVNRRHSFTDPKSQSSGSVSQKQISETIRKKLLTHGLFSTSTSQEKLNISSSPLRDRASSFLSVENFNKLSLNEISDVIQHQKKRNDEMERKCKELEKENQKDSKNAITQQFNLFDVKKKILSAIDEYIYFLFYYYFLFYFLIFFIFKFYFFIILFFNLFYF